MTEQWRDVPEFEGLYQVSDLGRLKSFARPSNPGRIMEPDVLLGYLIVTFYRGSKARKWRVHRLVMHVFCGPCPEGYEVDHINRVRDDNRLENLRYVTHHENRMQGFEALRSRVGEQHPFAKFTNQQVREIRRLRSENGCLIKELAQMYKTSTGTICNIVNRRSWKHLSDAPHDATLPDIAAYEDMNQVQLRQANNRVATMFRRDDISEDTFNRHWSIIDALLRIIDAADEVIRWQKTMTERQDAYRKLLDVEVCNDKR